LAVVVDPCFRRRGAARPRASSIVLVLIVPGLLVLNPAGAAGGPVIAEVADISQRFIETAPPLTPPLMLDRSFSVDRVGDGRAFVISGPQAILGASMETPMARNPDGSILNLGVYQVEAKLTDTYTFSGSSNPFLGHLIAHGKMILPPTDIQGDGIVGTASIIVGAPPGTGLKLFDQVALTTTPGDASLPGVTLVDPGTIPVDLSTDFIVDPSKGPFEFSFDLRLSGGNGAALDFAHTAEVTFDLPPGITVTSLGGFQSPATAVPEPRSILSLAVALVSLGAVWWRRRHLRVCF
jgi:hypothetical protein